MARSLISLAVTRRDGRRWSPFWMQRPQCDHADEGDDRGDRLQPRSSKAKTQQTTATTTSAAAIPASAWGATVQARKRVASVVGFRLIWSSAAVTKSED